MAIAVTVVAAATPAQPNTITVTGLTPTTTVVTFRRTYGTTLEDIPGAWVANASGVVTYTDYLYPLDLPVTYQVFSSDGLTLLATSAPSTPVPSGGRPWIRDLIFPALRYAPVTIVEVGDRTRAGRISPYWVMAQPYAVTIGDVRSGSVGTLQLYCASHAERDTVLYAMSTGNPCALQVPAGCRAVIDPMYFAPQDITETRFGSAGKCLLTVDYTEVDLSEVATFQPVTYGVQTQNAAAAAVLYGSLLPNPSGLSLAFRGKTYTDMYLSPTGIAP